MAGHVALSMLLLLACGLQQVAGQTLPEGALELADCGKQYNEQAWHSLKWSTYRRTSLPEGTVEAVVRAACNNSMHLE